MNAGAWVALAAVVVTVLGGGFLGVSKLTRIAVAVETLVDQIRGLTKAQSDLTAIVQQHENRLNKAHL